MIPPTPDLDALKAEALQHETMGNWQAALTLYQQLLPTHGNNADLHNDIAMAYEKVGDPAQAEAHYRQALTLDSEFYAAAYNLAQLIRARSTQDDTLAAFIAAHKTATTPQERDDVLTQLEAVTGETVQICASCDCISPNVAVFTVVPQGLVCPYCLEQSHQQSLHQRRRLIGLSLGAMVLLLLATAPFPYLLFIHFIVGALLVHLLSFFAVIVIHEAGHALTALATGGKLFAVLIGSGPLLATFTLGNTTIRLNTYPFGGLIACYFPPQPQIRLRAVATVLAGPLFNLGVGLALVWVINTFSLNPYYAYMGLYFFTGMNLLLGVVNLIPLPVPSVGVANDGAQLLALATQPDEVKKYSLSHYLTAYGAALSNSQPDYQEMLRAAEEGLTQMQEHPYLLQAAGIANLEMGHLENARDYFERQLNARATAPMGDRGLALNNVAYCQALQGEGDAALATARQAFWLVPWVAPVISTYGTALVENGAYEQGIARLMEAFHKQSTDYGKASALAHAAKGHALAGRRAEALALLHEAEQYTVQPAIVGRIKAELA